MTVEKATEVGYDGIVLQIRGHAQGDATLTVSTPNGLTDTANVNVGKQALSLTLNSESYSMTGTGDTEDVTVTIDPADSTSDLSYFSSNEQIFTVAKDVSDKTKATLTSVGVGEATLEVQSSNGRSTDATVTVTAE